MVFVQRPRLVQQLRQQLQGLLKEPGWVVLHGMAGSGKSVLAAEAVRDHALLEGDWLTWVSLVLFGLRRVTVLKAYEGSSRL